MPRKHVYSGGNIGHWLADPLDAPARMVLRRVAKGFQRFDRDRFEVAYLIARECVEADPDRPVLRLTEKGEDALDFYGPEFEDENP